MTKINAARLPSQNFPKTIREIAINFSFLFIVL